MRLVEGGRAGKGSEPRRVRNWAFTEPERLILREGSNGVARGPRKEPAVLERQK